MYGTRDVAVDASLIESLNPAVDPSPEDGAIEAEDMLDEFRQLLECGFTSHELATHIAQETGLSYDDVLDYIS